MAKMDAQGSVYVPLDNWVYSALDRLHALGYVDTAYLGLRPWTRISIAHMLELSADKIESENRFGHRADTDSIKKGGFYLSD